MDLILLYLAGVQLFVYLAFTSSNGNSAAPRVPEDICMLKIFSYSSIEKHRQFSSSKLSSALVRGLRCVRLLQDSDWMSHSTALASVTKMLPRLLDVMQWKVVLVIHDTMIGSDVLYLSDHLSYQGVAVHTYAVDEDTTSEDIHYQILSHYHHNQVLGENQTNLLLLCTEDSLLKVIHQINTFDYRNKNHTAIWKFSKWLIFSDDARTENFTANLEADNVVVISVSLGKRDKHQGDGGFSGMLYTLLYKPGGRQLSPVGSFAADGTVRISGKLFPNSHLGLNGKKLKIGTNVWYPFVMKSSSNSSTVFEGLCLDLLMKLSFDLNFTYEVVLPSDGEWGTIVNGSWTGLVHGVQKRELDMVIAPMTVTPEREAVMDFSFPFYYDRGIGIYKKSGQAGSKWMSLVRPLSSVVLACIGTCVVLTSVLLFAIEGILWTHNHHSTGARAVYRASLTDIFLILYGSVLTRAANDIPLSISGRVLVGFWSLFCIVIAAAYCGNLIAFLTVNKDLPPFQTLTDIAAQTQYKWGTTGGTSWITYFKTSNSTIMKDLWNKMVEFSRSDPDILSSSPEVHRQKVLAGYYVYFGNRDTLATWKSEACDLELTRETFYPYSYAVGLPHNSPLYDMISSSLLNIEESGLLLKWKRKWWPRDSGFCIYINPNVSISMEDIQGVFYLVAIGVALASVVFLLERFMASQIRYISNTVLANCQFS